MSDTLLTAQQVADYFQIDEATLNRWIKRGIISPSERFMRHRRFHRNAVERAIQENLVKANEKHAG